MKLLLCAQKRLHEFTFLSGYLRWSVRVTRLDCGIVIRGVNNALITLELKSSRFEDLVIVLKHEVLHSLFDLNAYRALKFSYTFLMRGYRVNFCHRFILRQNNIICKVIVITYLHKLWKKFTLKHVTLVKKVPPSCHFSSRWKLDSMRWSKIYLKLESSLANEKKNAFTDNQGVQLRCMCIVIRVTIRVGYRATSPLNHTRLNYIPTFIAINNVCEQMWTQRRQMQRPIDIRKCGSMPMQYFVYIITRGDYSTMRIKLV